MKIIDRTISQFSDVIRLLSAVCILVMAAIGIGVYGAPAGDMAVLFLFFVFYIQLPGLLIVRWTGLGRGHISTALALGALSGWAAELLVYFINDFIGNDLLLAVTGPVMSAAYIYEIIRNRDGVLMGRRFHPEKIPVSFCIFMVLVLLYCLVNTQYIYLAPPVNELTYMNPDKAYHMGLINSLSHDYPLQSPWISGVYITYHIFSEMMLSIPVRLFGIQADVITMSFGPFLTAYTFGISYYSFFREMSAKPERAGLYSLLVILANIYATRSIKTSIAFTFILINDNSSGYGMAAALMCIIAFRKWYESFRAGERKQYRKLVLLTALIMLAAGIKGPMGAVIIASIWGTMLLGMILRKVPPKTILPLAGMTAGFVLVYVFVLGSKGQANASGSSVIAFAKIADIAFWKYPLVDALKAHGVPTIISYAVLMTVFMIFFFSVFFLPFCIGYVRELILVLSGRKEFDPPKVLVYAACMVGIAAMFILSYGGHSQIYFGLVSAFLAPMIAFWFIEDMEAAKENSKAALYTLKACTAVMAVSLLFTTFTLAAYYDDRINTAVNNTVPTTNADRYLSISNEEYEALEWIEDNTEEDALLATDRYFSVDPAHYSYENRWNNRFFLYEVYCNRFSYISGSGYNMRAADWTKRRDMIETNMELYDPDNESRGNKARELGVDYVIVSKRFTDTADLSNEDYELCYSNDDVDVYKIAS